MKSSAELKVTSHVGRDLLASSAAFKTEASAVWEYVVNSLQYVERGVAPRVQVDVRPGRRIVEIRDNGMGMSEDDLRHFFTMHGENLDRIKGRPGRGKFGTGKSAAFGIATSLRVATSRAGLHNEVILTRGMIEKSSGKDIAVDWLVRNEATNAPNGTTVTIEDVLVKLKTAPIIEYIERHLQAFRGLNPEVAVNSHLCAHREPEVETSHFFEPSPQQKAVLGDVELNVRVSRAPLAESDRGVAVTAGVGNLIAVETAGVENKEFGSYLFGEIDVPALEASDSPIAAYDTSRSLELNPQHPVVQVLIGFVGAKLEEVRKDLVRRSKDAQKDERVRRLAVEADKIAEILNEDFRNIVRRLQEIRAVASRPGSAGAQHGGGQETGEDSDSWTQGTSEPGRVIKTGRGGKGTGGKGRPAPEVPPRGEPDPEGSDTLDPVGGVDKRHRRPRGGFRVEYKNLGKSEDRSRYDSSALAILINLDHSVVAAALGDGRVEDPAFRRLSYEVAFSEYAMGLGYEVLKQDPSIPADDLLYEVRNSLNRVAASAAPLYR